MRAVEPLAGPARPQGAALGEEPVTAQLQSSAVKPGIAAAHGVGRSWGRLGGGCGIGTDDVAFDRRQV